MKINFKKVFFITFIITALYEILIKLTNIFNPFKIIAGNICDIAHPYKLFIFQYLRYDDSSFLS